MTSHLASHHIAHILHGTFFHPHHSHIKMNKAQHPTSGITNPHRIIPPHFTLHHSTSNTISHIIPNHTTFHVRPFLTISHISYHTNTSIPFCNTIFQIALYRPHYAAHHMSHCTPFHITYHIRPHAMHSTAHFRSYIGHIVHCTTTSHIAPHFQDNVAPNFTCRSISCIIASFLDI